MKIKVVDMTYEQALAQPPQVHKKPKKPSLLFRTILRAASAPDLLATHFHCEKIGMAQIKSDEPCLVLMNHSCFLDLKIAEAVLYPRPFNIVCTSDGFVGKEWLMRSVGCIPTRKFCSDAALVRDMLYCVRTLKTSVLLYPEASYSFGGTALVGDPTDPDTLRQGGIDNCDAVAAVSEDDSVNLMAAQIAKSIFRREKVICRVSDPHLQVLYHKAYEIDTICPTVLTEQSVFRALAT